MLAQRYITIRHKMINENTIIYWTGINPLWVEILVKIRIKLYNKICIRLTFQVVIKVFIRNKIVARD